MFNGFPAGRKNQENNPAPPEMVPFTVFGVFVRWYQCLLDAFVFHQKYLRYS